MLKLVEFIKQNENWEELLSRKPYSLSIKQDENYIKFNYNQIESNFSNPIVQEARGIILRKDNLKPVAIPFFKFFNYGEGNAAKIDWNTARALEKIDGSIITVWYDVYKWHISTNGTLNAFEAPLQFASGYLRTFGDLFMDALHKSAPKEVINDICNNTTLILKPQNTYIFELTSLLNKVVVTYPENKIFHIGTRNNETLKEFEVDIGVTKPKLYKFSTFEEMLEVVRNFPKDQEGIVLVDAEYNRNKIKGIQYLLFHRMKGEGNFTKKRAIELALLNEQDEFLSAFSEFKPLFDEVNSDFMRFKNDFKIAQEEAKEKLSLIKKDYADWVSRYILKTEKKYLSGFLFDLYVHKKDYEQYIKELTLDKICKYLYKE